MTLYVSLWILNMSLWLLMAPYGSMALYYSLRLPKTSYSSQETGLDFVTTTKIVMYLMHGLRT